MPREDGWASSFASRHSFVLENLDKIAKLLDSLHDAALEETVRLEVGIVLLHEHVGSQENGITLACRCILCGRRLPEQCPIPTIRGSHAPSCNFALIREVRSRIAPPRLHTLSCLITVIFLAELSRGSENLL
jgi:hypothetical protein